MRVELRDLEGACDAARGHLAGREARDVLAAKEDPAVRGLHVAGDDVDERRLAGAVRADDPDDLALLEPQAQVVGGLHRPEGAGDRYRFQDNAHHRSFRGVGFAGPRRASRSKMLHSPPGANRMTTSRTDPSSSCQVYGEILKA